MRETLEKNEKIDRSACESIKIFNRLKEASIDKNKKLFSGKGCVFSTEKIDTIDGIDFKLINSNHIYSDYGENIYDFVIVVCREILNTKIIFNIMRTVKSNSFIVFYNSNPHYVIHDSEEITTLIKSSEIMHNFLIRIKNIIGIDFEVFDAMSIPLKVPFINCDKNTNEYFYQVIVRISNNLFGKKNLEDEAQLVDLDD